MKMIVGLGNPGKQYENTRHNIGFWVADELARPPSGFSAWNARFDGLASDGMIGAEKALLLKPMTFMNRSGMAVRKSVDFYKLAITDLLIICDDLSLPVGKLRLRPHGSSGGQNGLKDIFSHLGSDQIARLRIGIGARGFQDAASYVLSQFPAGERSQVEEAVSRAAQAACVWVREGIQAAMNQYNGSEKV